MAMNTLTNWKRTAALSALVATLLAGSAFAATRYFGGGDAPNCPPTPDCPCHHAGTTAQH